MIVYVHKYEHILQFDGFSSPDVVMNKSRVKYVLAVLPKLYLMYFDMFVIYCCTISSYLAEFQRSYVEIELEDRVVQINRPKSSLLQYFIPSQDLKLPSDCFSHFQYITPFFTFARCPSCSLSFIYLLIFFSLGLQYMDVSSRNPLKSLQEKVDLLRGV